MGWGGPGVRICSPLRGLFGHRDATWIALALLLLATLTSTAVASEQRQKSADWADPGKTRPEQWSMGSRVDHVGLRGISHRRQLAERAGSLRKLQGEGEGAGKGVLRAGMGQHTMTRSVVSRRRLSSREGKVWKGLSGWSDNVEGEDGWEDEALARRVFGRGKKYYWVVGGGDRCQGENHFTFSLTCLLAEARFLGRTLVLDTLLCIGASHNNGTFLQRPMEAYYNLDRVFSVYPAISQSVFMRADEARKRLGTDSEHPVTWGFFGMANSTQDLKRSDATVVTRKLQSDEWGFNICAREPESLKPNMGEWKALGHADTLSNIADRIVEALQGDFDSVHVRRGDKLYPVFWPHLDEDTRPEQLLKNLPKFIPPGRPIWIATNERTPGFFDPLKKLYKVYQLHDFAHLWNETSEWYSVTRNILGAGTTFDVRMQVIVDYKMFARGIRKVETFNDLARDPKDGVGVQEVVREWSKR